MDLKSEILSKIDPKDFYKEEFPEWDGTNSSHVKCPFSNAHTNGDINSSLSLQPDTGEYYCHGCGAKGSTVLGYYTDVKCSGNFTLALRELYQRYIGRTYSEQEVLAYHDELLRRNKLIGRLSQYRGWTRASIEVLRIGWDIYRKRCTIPIYNLDGLCINIIYHDSLNLADKINDKRVAMLTPKGSRTGLPYPLSPYINPFNKEELWLVEGEPDAIVCHSNGINAITVTGGVGAWARLDDEFYRALRTKDVVICLDNDSAGRKGVSLLCERISGIGVGSLKIIYPPEGKDITEYITKYGGSGNLLQRIQATTKYEIRPSKRSIELVHLSRTSEASRVGSFLQTDILINGKHYTPYAIPKTIKFACTSNNKCGKCPCKEVGFATHTIRTDNPSILDWLHAKEYTRLVCKEAGLPDCKMITEVEEYQNLEQISVIPSLTNSHQINKDSYCQRICYYAGHNIESNKSYRITAMPIVHSKTRESSLLVTDYKGSSDSLESFNLTKPEVEHLRSVFSGRKPLDLIKLLAKYFSQNHTKIYKRWELHAITDLTFHSPRAFRFAGSFLPKGSIEILIMGDTRCGKGQVAEGLIRYYDSGEIISGENASFMGLCGGVTKVGDNFQLTWGAIPLNHGRLLIIDEFSGLDTATLGKLSRIRSEGVAEINKGGIAAKTAANARLIWIANPRGGRDVSSFNSGIECIRDLIGASEDIARFDLAFIVCKGEVPIELINTLANKESTTEKLFNRDDLKKVLLWGWSRNEDQIKFNDDTTAYILDESIKLSADFSSSIPLIQGENIRFKFAKLAAATAIRCFSCDSEGRTVIVGIEHAKFAAAFIRHIYSMEVFGYKRYSVVEKKTAELSHLDILDKLFKEMGEDTKRQVIEGLMMCQAFTKQDVMDWTNFDLSIAGSVAGDFVRCNAVKQIQGGKYMKKPSFIKYLTALLDKD